jgi:type IV secretion system protein VirB5
MTHRCIHAFFIAAGLLAVSPSHAQFAVIDVASLTQLVSQVRTLQQQVATARSQLSQAQAEYQAMTGARGMQQLLAGTPRNYLPASWPALQAVLAGGRGYPALSTDLQAQLFATAVLAPQRLATLSPAAATQLQNERQSVALLQSLSHAALANSSTRFAALQQLVDAIGRAGDQKAILELQARIGAEQGMLQNEHTKLQELYQSVQAQQWADAQRGRELTVSGHGQFASRFQPQL